MHHFRSRGRSLCTTSVHMTSLELDRVTSKTVFNEIVDIVERHGLPWGKLISILMGFCSVRYSRSGVQQRIRRNKAAHLLDIDGDLIHHIQKTAPRFNASHLHAVSLKLCLWTCTPSFTTLQIRDAHWKISVKL